MNYFDHFLSENGFGAAQPEQQVSVPAPEIVPGIGVKLEEAERRIILATYYRQVLNDSMFDSQDVFTQQVEREVRDFVKGRLEELLGMRKPTPTLGFSDEDIKILKDFLKALKLKASATVTPTPKSVQQVPTVQPTPPPTPHKRPGLRKRKIRTEQVAEAKDQPKMAEVVTPDGKIAKINVGGQTVDNTVKRKPAPKSRQELQALEQMQAQASVAFGGIVTVE